MSRISYYLKKARSMPPDALCAKIINKILNLTKNKIQKLRDISGDTRIKFNVSPVRISYVNLRKLDVSNINLDVARYLSKMYLEH